MKKAPNLRLSLRKLLIAAMAVGPLAVLPTPVWAVLPTYNATTNTGSFTVTNGSATVTTAATVANISTTDRAVLVWGANTTGAPFTPDATTITNFNIQAGETYNFVLPTGGAVLNRVRAGNNTSNATYAGVAAYIGGSLLSNGRVLVLSDSGHITLANGAIVNTQGGLVLSTLAETSDIAFITQGNLTNAGAATGNISIGTATVSGNLAAYGGAITSAAPTLVTGDVILRAVTSGQAISLGAGSVTGNLSVATNNAAITQTGALVVGSSGGNQTATFESGTGSITLDAGAGAVTGQALITGSNDFQVVNITTSGTSDVTINDRNIVTLGTSTIGRDLTVNAGGRTNTTGISTNGAVTVGRDATFNVTASNNSAINVGSNSTIGGTVNASTAGGAITINTTGNLTTGTISSNVTTNLGALASVTVAPTLTAANSVAGIAVGTAGAGYTAAPTVTIAAPNVAGGTQATATATIDATGAVTGITVTNAGTGYTAAPAVTLSAPPAGGTQATAGAITLGSSVSEATLVATSGLGVFASAPTVAFSAPAAGGIRATGTVGFDSSTGQVTGITVTNAGTAYTAVPTLTFTPSTAATAVTGRNISVTTTGALSVNGAIATSNNSTSPSVSVTGGSVGFTATGSINNSGSVTVNSTAGDVVLGAVTGNRLISRATGGNITQNTGTVITTDHAAGTSTFNATGNITLDNANVIANGSTVQFTGGNTVAFRSTNSFVVGTTNVTGNLTLTADNAAARNIVLGTGTGTGNAQNITVGGVLRATVPAAGTITDNDYTVFNVFGGLNLTSTSGAITLDAASAFGSLAPRVQFGQVNASTTGAVTVAETTTLNLGNITAGTLNAISVGGGIIDTGNITVTGTASFAAAPTGSVVLDNANNSLPTISLGGGVDNTISNLNANVTLSGGTTGTGTTSIGTNSGRSITIGSGTFVGNLALTSGGGIDVAGNAVVNGNLTLATTGNLTGAVAGFTTTSTLTGGAVTAISTGGLSALTFASAPTVTIAAPPAGGTQATATATLTDGVITGFTIVGGAGYAAAPAVTFSGASVTGITETAGTLTVAGTTSVTSTGDVNLFRGNDFTNVVLNGSGRNVVLNDVNDLTVSGSTAGMLTATAGGGSAVAGGPSRIANPWSLTLGNLNVRSLVATAQNGGAGNSGRITQQSGTRLHSEGLTRFTTTNNSITIGNNGNNFGRVEVFTNNDGNTPVTIVEDGTLRLGNLNSRGSANITSRFGSVIEDPTANVDITNNGTLTVSAPNGSILIGNTTHTTGTTTGNLTAFTGTAPNGAVAVMSLGGDGNIALGNVTGLSLTVTAGRNVTQTGRLSIFGTTNITAGRAITLGNTTNNFGRVFLTTTGASTGDITITEGGTLNLGGVTMAAGASANFTATSVNGDIIDSGLGGVRPGGVIGTVGTGVVTFNAMNGNVTIDDPTSDFPTSGGVVFNANNVTLAVLGQAPLVLGANNTTSTATNLTVTSATGNILNAGTLTVSGDAAFQSGNGDITLTQSGNRFGTVRFAGRNVRINQLNDINIVTGSSATGIAEFGSQSYITIANRGGIVTFGSTANFTAAGSIVLPKLLQAVGTLTVNSPNLKDLSALSLASDLSGRSPVNQGVGEYRPPNP